MADVRGAQSNIAGFGEVVYGRVVLHAPHLRTTGYNPRCLCAVYILSFLDDWVISVAAITSSEGTAGTEGTVRTEGTHSKPQSSQSLPVLTVPSLGL